MARNLKSFRKHDRGAEGMPDVHNNENKQPSEADINGAQRANIENMVNEYGGKSEAELMDELMRVTSQQKREGSFDPEAMKRTASSIMPMLTPEQQMKLKAIMSRLGG